jgi:hypothetical protein
VATLSTPSPRDGEDVLVFDTFSQRKRFVTGIVEVVTGTGAISERGHRSAEWADVYHRATHRAAAEWLPVRAATVPAAPGASAKVEQTFALAADGSLILFFGHTAEILAAFEKALGVKRREFPIAAEVARFGG